MSYPASLNGAFLLLLKCYWTDWSSGGKDDRNTSFHRTETTSPVAVWSFIKKRGDF